MSQTCPVETRGQRESGTDCATRVHGLEANPQTLNWVLTDTQRRLLGYRLHHQLEVISAVEGSGLQGCQARATRINCCSQCVSVGTGANGVPAVRIHRCRDRLCQICQRYRSIAAQERIEALLRTMLSPKLLTLTLADDGQPLLDRLQRLMQSYRDLRRRQAWSANVRGSVAVVEITRGADGQHWHTHLHVLIDAPYIPKATLVSEWLEITGDSYIVDIRAVPDGAKTARYLAKYAAKGCDTSKLNHECLVEYVNAMYRRRTLITAGDCHGRANDVDDWEPSNAIADEPVSLSQVKSAARRGSIAACNVLRLMSLAGGLCTLLSGIDRSTTETLTPETWAKQHGKDWRGSLQRVREWLDRNGPAGLPKPPPYTGAQTQFPRPG